MPSVWKRLVSFFLPVTVIVVVPTLLELKWPDSDILTLDRSWLKPALSAVAVSFILLGSTLMYKTIKLFHQVGKGTLAPWNATKHLVVLGPYRYVRNPMISGVLMNLLGLAIILNNKWVLLWAAFFFILNTVYFVVYEEPDLEKKFGDEYRQYKKKVRRWLPRIKPFIPTAST